MVEMSGSIPPFAFRSPTFNRPLPTVSMIRMSVAPSNCCSALHMVTEAANGHEALQLFTGSRYDLVITDYRMPGMLGDELARNIKNLLPAQPILMMTAYIEKLLDAGKPADAVLGKPFSIDDLRRAMAMPTDNATPTHACENHTGEA
jgi:CheY-like chemotaxis protein